MRDVKRVLKSLAEAGLLLLQDKTIPCVVFLVAGERMAGSWWSHPSAGAIFRCLRDLQDHADVLETKSPNAQAKLPGPPARTLKLGNPGWRPRSASAVGSAACQRSFFSSTKSLT